MIPLRSHFPSLFLLLIFSILFSSLQRFGIFTSLQCSCFCIFYSPPPSFSFYFPPLSFFYFSPSFPLLPLLNVSVFVFYFFYFPPSFPFLPSIGFFLPTIVSFTLLKPFLILLPFSALLFYSSEALLLFIFLLPSIVFFTFLQHFLFLLSFSVFFF